MPAGVVPGVELYVQWWIDDPAAPEALAGSNALTVVTE